MYTTSIVHFYSRSIRIRRYNKCPRSCNPDTMSCYIVDILQLRLKSILYNKLNKWWHWSNQDILSYYIMSILLLHLYNNQHRNQHILWRSSIRYTSLFSTANNSLLFSLRSSQQARCNIGSKLNSGTVYNKVYCILHNHLSCIILNLYSQRPSRFHRYSFYGPILGWMNQGFLQVLHSPNQS